jgi:hypothetical protein
VSDRAQLESIRDVQAQIVDAKLEQVSGGRAVELAALASSAFEQSARQAALAPDDPAVVERIRLCGQAYAALFALARTGGAAVEVPLGDTVVRLEGQVDASTTHAAALVSGMWAAIAAGDLASGVLLAVTPARIARRSPSRTDEYVHALALALKGFLTGDPATGDRVISALEAADPDRVEIADADWVLDLTVPELDVLSRIVEHDAVAFADALGQAVELHREYWARDPGFSGALLPVSLVALAVIGRDAGLGAPPAAAALPQAPLRNPPPAAVVCCPYCITPLAASARACPACRQDVTRDAPLELSPAAWRALPRKACSECDAHVPEIATRCPACG